jgi:hypothetical protein
MPASLGQLIKSVLFVSTFVAALMAFPATAHAHSRFRSAINAGVAGAAAGYVAGNALSGAMPQGGNYPQPNPAPMPNCTDELQQQRGPYFNRIGQRRVCY